MLCKASQHQLPIANGLASVAKIQYDQALGTVLILRVASFKYIAGVELITQTPVAEQDNPVCVYAFYSLDFSLNWLPG